MMLNRPAIVRLFAAICLLLVTACPGWAETYYVKNGGNNSLDGLSDATAWETISKVNSSVSGTSDCVYFKRGDTFNDATLYIDWAGTDLNRVIIGAYGSGDKPKIISHANSQYSLVSADKNYITIQDIEFINETYDTGQGIKLTADYALVQRCKVRGFYNYGIYSVPGAASNSIEICYNEVYNCPTNATSTGGIEHRGNYVADGISIHDNLVYNDSWSTAKGAGISIYPQTAGGSATNALIYNNTIHDVALDAIRIANTVDNIFVYNNSIYNCKHSGLHTGGSSTGSVTNAVLYDNNIAETFLDSLHTDGAGILIDEYSSGSIAHNNTITNAGESGIKVNYSTDNKVFCNLIINSGEHAIEIRGGASSTGPSDGNMFYNNTFIHSVATAAVKLSTGIGAVDANVIKNNIFYGDLLSSIAIDREDSGLVENDFNCWNGFATFSGGSESIAIGSNSINTDPLFFNASANDYRLRFDSPCRWAGTPISGLSVDYAGNYISPNHPDIGAYQYQPSICKHIINHYPSKQRIIREVIQ